MPTAKKFFNTEGPGIPEDHYMVDPLRRIDYDEIATLIGQKRYFVLHAPRQTGKTTSLLAMVKKINEEGRYHCVYMNVESAQTARDDVEAGMRAILTELGEKVKRFLDDAAPLKEVPKLLADSGGHKALSSMLSAFCQKISRPLVLFIDEIDALAGDTLVSVLRQLRAGYESRPQVFPISVVLCGVRDVRDYRIHTSKGDIVTGGSCFNIKAASLRLGDFSQEEVRELYEQHTAATGQVFEENIYPRVWALTRGQPWLVNALALQATFKMKENRDRSRPITLNTIEEAAEQLIIERATHLDQLTDKLREERVRRVIAPMIAGEEWPEDSIPNLDDVQYVIDLGLIRQEGKRLSIANDIYREVIPRDLTTITQFNMASRPDQPWYVRPDGRLDTRKLIREFQRFCRENIESWLERFDYKEAGFQLLLQAFLQRIVNGGGLIDREYALGSGRVDLLVRWRVKTSDTPARDAPEQRFVLELKTIRQKSRDPNRALSDGLEQTARYAQRSNAEEAHLIICDERSGRSWDEKIYERAEHRDGREIHVWGV
ncbi:MAG: AAA-like domain-containing protein [Synergistaceae bacterium]|jgi:hypothetical protein|nr:AAA-like domain-containing protein [Synergistaceae bacterium]